MRKRRNRTNLAQNLRLRRVWRKLKVSWQLKLLLKHKLLFLVWEYSQKTRETNLLQVLDKVKLMTLLFFGWESGGSSFAHLSLWSPTGCTSEDSFWLSPTIKLGLCWRRSVKLYNFLFPRRRHSMWTRIQEVRQMSNISNTSSRVWGNVDWSEFEYFYGCLSR